MYHKLKQTIKARSIPKEKCKIRLCKSVCLLMQIRIRTIRPFQSDLVFPQVPQLFEDHVVPLMFTGVVLSNQINQRDLKGPVLSVL